MNPNNQNREEEHDGDGIANSPPRPIDTSWDGVNHGGSEEWED